MAPRARTIPGLAFCTLLCGLAAFSAVHVYGAIPSLCLTASPSCSENLFGDGNCDVQCNHPACEFDRGDCAGLEAHIKTPQAVDMSEVDAPANGDDNLPRETIDKAGVHWVQRNFTDGAPYYRPNYACEICMTTLLRKLAKKDSSDSVSLCDNYNTAADVDMCREVLDAMTLYDRFLVDWLYGMGCQWDEEGTWQPIIPCPPHVVCSWVFRARTTANRVAIDRPFCEFTDAAFRRSPSFYKKHGLEVPQDVE